MIAVIDKSSVSFDEFIKWYPENSQNRYELRRGVITEMPKPRGQHSKLAGDLSYELGKIIRESNQTYFIPKECIIKLSSNTLLFTGSFSVVRRSPNPHSPRLILSLLIFIKHQLMRISLGGKPLFEGAFRDGVKSKIFNEVRSQKSEVRSCF